MSARQTHGPVGKERYARFVPALPVLLAGVFCLVGVLPGATRTARDRVRQALDSLPLDSQGARERAFGAGYAQAIEEIRRRLPEGSAYLLAADGVVITDFVAYDLAPRKALLLDGRLPTLRSLRRRRGPAGLPPFSVVVPGSGAPPRLVATSTLTGPE